MGTNTGNVPEINQSHSYICIDRFICRQCSIRYFEQIVIMWGDRYQHIGYSIPVCLLNNKLAVLLMNKYIQTGPQSTRVLIESYYDKNCVKQNMHTDELKLKTLCLSLAHHGSLRISRLSPPAIYSRHYYRFAVAWPFPFMCQQHT